MEKIIIKKITKWYMQGEKGAAVCLYATQTKNSISNF